MNAIHRLSYSGKRVVKKKKVTTTTHSVPAQVARSLSFLSYSEDSRASEHDCGLGHFRLSLNLVFSSSALGSRFLSLDCTAASVKLFQMHYGNALAQCPASRPYEMAAFQTLPFLVIDQPVS